MRKQVLAIILVAAAALSACSPVPPKLSGSQSRIQPASSGASAVQIADLSDVDTSVEATGASIRDLITSEDVRRIIGREDVVFAGAN